jgi:hypothetical protein
MYGRKLNNKGLHVAPAWAWSGEVQNILDPLLNRTLAPEAFMIHSFYNCTT